MVTAFAVLTVVQCAGQVRSKSTVHASARAKVNFNLLQSWEGGEGSKLASMRLPATTTRMEEIKVGKEGTGRLHLDAPPRQDLFDSTVRVDCELGESELASRAFSTRLLRTVASSRRPQSELI